jgi:hypothetical protein
LLAIARHDLTELFIAREQLIEWPQFFQRKRRKRLASVLVHETTKPLMLGYASDVALYPKFQAYFRNRQPPLLAVWGRNDPFFLPAGAKPIGPTSRVLMFASSIRATSRWKRIARKSRLPFATSSAERQRRLPEIAPGR